MASLTIIILTKNEEQNLEKCIASFKGVAQRIVIVDSYSTDKTVELAKSLGAEVYEHRFENHAAQFNWALDNVNLQTEWVMKVDADEEFTSELADEIDEKLDGLPEKVNGVILRRRVYFMGRWLKHGGKYPELLLRIFRVGHGMSEMKLMDEHLIVTDGDVVTFKNDFSDNNNKSLEWWINKHNWYSNKEVLDQQMKSDATNGEESVEETSTSMQAMNKQNRIGILGAGTWGMALAKMLAETGKVVEVWSPIEQELVQLREQHTHPKLSGVIFPQNIEYTNSVERVCQSKEIILFAVPSVFVRSTAQKIKPYIPNGQIIVDVAKGIEADTLMTLTEVIGEELSDLDTYLVALSGPTHAEEVAMQLPTTIVSACKNKDIAKRVQEFFTSPYMRVYTNTDVRGIEICGALKNVIALAAGISKGMGYGDNAKAALITRGLTELERLGGRIGCSPNTFSGLTGMGDLIVTCTSEHSRNNQCGQLIGQGVPTDQAIKQVGMVVEGINALPAAVQLAEQYQVEMPIIMAVNAIINGGKKPKDIVDALIKREQKSEITEPDMEQYFETSVINKMRSKVMKRVITYGTFDLLHYGHINILRRAKELGDYLVVALSTDEFNWNEKQKKCYFTYEQRKQLLEAIRYVDLVIPETCWEQKRTDVHEYHIDTFVIGDDWEGKFDFLKEEGVEVVYLPRTPEISTTQIKRDLNK